MKMGIVLAVEGVKMTYKEKRRYTISCIILFIVIHLIVNQSIRITILKTSCSNFAGLIVRHRDFYGWVKKSIKSCDNEKKENRWYYIGKNRKLIKGKFKLIDKKIYEFDEYGRLVENEGFKELKNENKMYFKKETFGAYVSTAVKIESKICYFNSEGYLIYEEEKDNR